MIILNCSADGQSEFIEKLPDGNEYILRTTYVCGINSHWLLDIYDIDNKPVLLGIVCTCGANLLLGQGNRLNHMKAWCCDISKSSERDSEALGSTLYIIFQSEDEEDLITYQDRFDALQFVNS